MGNGDGTFQAAVNYAAGSGPHSVAVGDFNGDGKPDLVVANYGGSVSVLLGNGDGTFQAAANYAAGSAPYFVAVGDFNGDGKLDLAVANYVIGGVGTVSVLLGNGDGTFKAAVNYATGSGTGPYWVGVGDFNGDGHPDLAVAAVSGLSVLLGNGDGTFKTAGNYAAGNAPYSVVVGDFNGDGNTDLVVANISANPGTVSVLLGKGDGTFQAPVKYTVGNTPRSVAVGDFNGDGKADLAVANLWDGVSVLLGNGDGTFQAAVNYAAGAGPFSVAVGDFNGDGKPDLAVANQDNGSVTIILNLTTLTVPNVVGDTEAAAATAITGAGLVLGTVTTASSSTVPIGNVISESPAAGTPVNGGTAVDLVLSSGAAVPDVVGQPQAAATTAITGAGLVLGTVTTASSSTVPIGNVISESPAAGTPVNGGTAVNVVVSSGVAVPNVVGATQAAATTAITGAGLVLGTVTTASSSTVPIGNVISESPAAGTPVNGGTAVNVVVSSGVAVPNVVGATQAAATTAITGAGLVLGTVTTASSSTVPIGNVISESPAAGTPVNGGTAVNVVVSSGVAVPNVVGATQAAATTAITGAGLVLGTVTTASSSTVPIGNVISESPAAGTPVNGGTAVNVVVSSGVAVPNVVGATQAAATTAITGAGLVLGTVTTASSSTVPIGNVISESPAAGTPVNGGTAVNVVISSGRAATSTVVATSLTPAFYGQMITFTATVTDASSGSSGTPTGTVTFYDATVAFGTSSLNPSGQTAYSTFVLPGGAGAQSITAVYSGDPNFSRSTSSSILQTITAAPVVSLDPDAITFHSEDVNTTSAPMPVVLTNQGNATLTIVGIQITGGNNGDFSIVTNTCGSSLAALSSCTVSVVFSPRDTGTRTSSLSFTDNNDGIANSNQLVSLTGSASERGVSQFFEAADRGRQHHLVRQCPKREDTERARRHSRNGFEQPHGDRVRDKWHGHL